MQIKILGRLENGRYEAEVNNRHIILKSNRELKSGKIFDGELSFQNGKILVKTDENSIFSPAFEVMNFTADGDILPAEIVSFLEKLNLPADNLSFQILLQFKQLGLRFDGGIMKEIRRLSKKTENPVKTARKLSVLHQKGVDITKFAENLEGIFECFNKKEESGENNQNEQIESDFSFISKADYIEIIKDFFEKLETSCSGNRIGELSVLNHLGFKSGSFANSWVVIPFEIHNNLKNTVTGDGFFKLLLSSSDKSIQKLHLSISLSQDDYRFILEYKGSHIEKVKYSTKSGKKMNCPYEFLDFEKTEDFGSGTEQFVSVGGLA